MTLGGARALRRIAAFGGGAPPTPAPAPSAHAAAAPPPAPPPAPLFTAFLRHASLALTTIVSAVVSSTVSAPPSPRASHSYPPTVLPRAPAMPHRALDYGSLPGPSRSRGRTPSAASAASHHVHIPLIPASAPPALFLARIGLRGGRLMMFVTLFASLGVLLFGYDQGVMSSLLVHPAFKHYFHDPNAAQIGTVVAILDIGALITSLLAGTLADRIGRKATIFWGAILLSIGGFLQTAALHLEMLTVGRIVAGFGIGFLTMIVPTYQSEISVAEHRGYLASIEYTLNISGYALSVWVGYGASFMTGDVSWRFPLSIQVVVGLILAVGSLFLPESPRYLLDKDRDLDAMRVLVELHSNKSDQHNKRARYVFLDPRPSTVSTDWCDALQTRVPRNQRECLIPSRAGRPVVPCHVEAIPLPCARGVQQPALRADERYQCGLVLRPPSIRKGGVERARRGAHDRH